MKNGHRNWRWRNSQIWVADFEDAPAVEGEAFDQWSPEDYEVRVWLWCAVNAFTGEKAHGADIVSFMRWLGEASKMVYFHNLKHDGQFILSFILNHPDGLPPVSTWHRVDEQPRTSGEWGVFIDDQGQHYSYRLCFSRKVHCEIRDSLKIVPLSVHELGSATGKLKGHLEDYERARPAGYVPTGEEVWYCFRDCEIVVDYVRKFYENDQIKMNKLTIGADSVALMKYLCFQKPAGSWKAGNALFAKHYPVLGSDEFALVRESYSGGLCFVNPEVQGDDCYNVISLDINSMYPAMQRYARLPYGFGQPFTGEPPKDRLWVARVTFSYSLKEGRFPTIHDHFFALRFSSFSQSGSSYEATVNSVEWKLINRQYDVWNVEWEYGYAYWDEVGKLAPFIDYLYAQKSKLSHSDPMRTICKRLLNSSYGKFGQVPRQQRCLPTLDGNGVVQFELSPDPEADEEAQRQATGYIPYASFVTAYARLYIMENIERVHQWFCYCDTDSMKIAVPDFLHGKAMDDWLHTLGVPLDDHKLGYFKNETGEEPVLIERFLRPKTYACFGKDFKVTSVTCAGLKEVSQVTYDNFSIGTTYDHGKLIPFQCKGGVTLQWVPFTITQ